MKIIYVDCETNGLDPQIHSVLSVAAIKVDVSDDNIKEIGRYLRYYFPTEPLRPEALAVNGLTTDVLKEKRYGCTYPLHYKGDVTALVEFCADAKLFVAHNIQFDSAFLGIPMRDTFCTSKANIGLLRHDKYPKLKDAAEYYGIQTPDDLHTAMADAEVCMLIFQKMMIHNDLFAMK